MTVQFAPSSNSARLARVMVSAVLTELGRTDLIDDVTAVASELVANGVMHAHTVITLAVEPLGVGVRVTVGDGSPVLPRWSPSSLTGISGRGLMLVDRLSSTWGAQTVPGGGKIVWAEILHATEVADDVTPEKLLADWSDEIWSDDPPADHGIKVILEIDVQAMLASRAHTEDLHRELQLTMLNDALQVTTASPPRAIVLLARQLDSASADFHDARRQMRDQTLRAAKRGEARTALHLTLHAHDAARAQRWLDALNQADALAATGALLLPPFPPELTAFRQAYIHEIIDQLPSTDGS